MDRALRSNVIVSALDARGLYVVVPGGDASQSGYSAAVSNRKSQYEMEGARVDADIMAELADGTGGRFVQNTNDLDAGLNGLSTPPEYYYLLAFSPQNLKYDGSYHPLKISLPESKGFTRSSPPRLLRPETRVERPGARQGRDAGGPVLARRDQGHSQDPSAHPVFQIQRRQRQTRRLLGSSLRFILHFEA